MDSVDLPTLLKNSQRELTVGIFTVCCVTIALVSDVNATLLQQKLLGACAWGALIILLRGETPAVRYQVAVAVMVATLGEYISSPMMESYIYRLHDVPAYVPPGHGMVYLAAVALGRSPIFRRYQRHITVVALCIGTVWGLWGAVLAPRGDAVGLVLFGIFLVFLRFGNAQQVYVAAFFLTNYLELLGTGLGTWAWAEHWPAPFPPLSQGNPPSGCPAWYCMVDAVAMAGAPALTRLVGNVQTWFLRTASEEEVG